MVNVDELKKQEKIKLQNEEVNLEDLIILGADKKIPILIEYPSVEGEIVNAKVLVKQLTIKEIEDFKLTDTNNLTEVLDVLTKTIFKNNGKTFTFEELSYLPVGVLKALFEKIFELSGIDINDQNKIKDF